MRREQMAAQAVDGKGGWDVVIIGGGATGLGVAVDASLRGYRTLLLEQCDFAKATSSRSTKMAHGGVRYLQQGNLSLVMEALRERGIMVKNAPHLAHSLAFIVPSYRWWEQPYYGTGLKLYDMLAGDLSFGSSRFLSRQATLDLLPNIEPTSLLGGVLFHDGQFDDARLAVNLAQTAAENGAVLLNYARVVDLSKRSGRVAGVRFLDTESGEEHEAQAKVVINATGPFTDAVRKLDEPGTRSIIRPSQGVHLVLDRKFLPGKAALMVPKTTDGRVLFAVPWHNRLLVGTTDTPVDSPSLEPRPFDREIDFILENVRRYLVRDPDRSDVLAAYAGVRPLVASGGNRSTSAISRDETILVSKSGLVTIAGGKWTTYRRMAQKTVDRAASAAALECRPCRTESQRIHGHTASCAEADELSFYGSDAAVIRQIARSQPAFAERIHPRLPVIGAQIVHAVREEMCRTVEDFLARRTRALLLDARASMEAADQVAAVMAGELGRDDAWRKQQTAEFRKLAEGYLPG